MSNSALVGIRQDLFGILLSRSGHVFILLCLGFWHLTLLWIKTQSQGEAHPQRRGWREFMTPGETFRTLLILFVVLAYINTWKDIEQPGRSSELLLGIDQSTNLMVLLVGIVASQISGMLLRSGDNDGFEFRYANLVFFVVFLAATSLVRFHIPHTYLYRSQVRWTGLWVNPNTFGVLMGVGVVMAVGLIFLILQTGRFRAAKVVFLGIATGFAVIGLLHSYSRGAWLGVSCGLIYLGFRVIGARGISQSKAIRWMHRNIVCTLIIVFSLALVAFWHFENAQQRLARRAFSVRSQNDFSLRNRLAAYEGALQMMADKPWFGFGWNKPEAVYTQYYRPATVDEGLAIELNDFFTLGTTLGLPALLCFVAYVAFSFMPKARDEVQRETKGLNVNLKSGNVQVSLIRAVCQAGAVVLLISFFFDGGLFKIALAVPFWILLELGSSEGAMREWRKSDEGLISLDPVGIIPVDKPQ